MGYSVFLYMKKKFSFFDGQKWLKFFYLGMLNKLISKGLQNEKCDEQFFFGLFQKYLIDKLSSSYDGQV